MKFSEQLFMSGEDDARRIRQQQIQKGELQYKMGRDAGDEDMMRRARRNVGGWFSSDGPGLLINDPINGQSQGLNADAQYTSLQDGFNKAMQSAKSPDELRALYGQYAQQFKNADAYWGRNSEIGGLDALLRGRFGGGGGGGKKLNFYYGQNGKRGGSQVPLVIDQGIVERGGDALRNAVAVKLGLKPEQVDPASLWYAAPEGMEGSRQLRENEMYQAVKNDENISLLEKLNARYMPWNLDEADRAKAQLESRGIKTVYSGGKWVPANEYNTSDYSQYATNGRQNKKRTQSRASKKVWDE